MIRIYPAYGRQYEQLDHFKRDFNSGKDFKFYNGMYFSKRDVNLMKKQGMTVLSLQGKFTVDLRDMKFAVQQINPIDKILGGI